MKGAAALVFSGALSGACLLGAAPAAATCSVFSPFPCTPAFCSVFRHRPCLPQFDSGIGQDLRLTIESRDQDEEMAGAHADEHELDSLHDLFERLHACWQPPSPAQARHGMQITARFAFTRAGELLARPRFTYTSPGVGDEIRTNYRAAVDAMLTRCVPLPLSKGLGGAVAGRPIAIRLIDSRTFPTSQQEQP